MSFRSLRLRRLWSRPPAIPAEVRCPVPLRSQAGAAAPEVIWAGKNSAFGSRKTCPGGAGVGLARRHGHLVLLHMMPGHQLGKMLCHCRAPPNTASSIPPSPLGHRGLLCMGRSRTSEIPGKGDSLPVQAYLQTRLPITSSSGEGFCTARRIYYFKTGATNVRAALAVTARCSQQEGY